MPIVLDDNIRFGLHIVSLSVPPFGWGGGGGAHCGTLGIYVQYFVPIPLPALPLAPL